MQQAQTRRTIRMKTTADLEKELEQLRDHNADLARQLAKALQAYAEEYTKRKELEKRLDESRG